MRVLVVEDDAIVGGTLVQALREAGYAVDWETDASAALVRFQTEVVDLAIVDIRLPGLVGGGIELCERIRHLSSDLPILMLTALAAPEARVRGLDVGADDYLVKPFHLGELLARVRALLRRARTAHPVAMHVGTLTLDPRDRTAHVGAASVDLSPREYAVLDYLMRRPDQIVTASDLIDHAWDGNFEGWSNVVPSTIRHLRRKLRVGEGLDRIVTHRGAGYELRSAP